MSCNGKTIFSCSAAQFSSRTFWMAASAYLLCEHFFATTQYVHKWWKNANAMNRNEKRIMLISWTHFASRHTWMWPLSHHFMIFADKRDTWKKNYIKSIKITCAISVEYARNESLLLRTLYESMPRHSNSLAQPIQINKMNRIAFRLSFTTI